MSFIKNILPSTRLRVFRLHADVVLRPLSVYWTDFQWVVGTKKGQPRGCPLVRNRGRLSNLCGGFQESVGVCGMAGGWRITLIP